MKHITFNTSPSPELAGPRESLEFSCKGLRLARLGNERNTSVVHGGGKGRRESQGKDDGL